MQIITSSSRRALLLFVLVALVIAGAVRCVGQERAVDSVTPDGDLTAPSLVESQLVAVEPATERVPTQSEDSPLTTPASDLGRSRSSSSFEPNRQPRVRVRWSVVDFAGPLPNTTLFDLGYGSEDLVVWVRPAGETWLGRSSYPVGRFLTGDVEIGGLAPVEVGLFLDGVEIDRIESLGTEADHDEQFGLGELTARLVLSVDALRDSTCELALRVADANRQLRVIELTLMDEPRRLFQVERGQSAWQRTVQRGTYGLRVMLDDGSMIEDRLDLGGAQHEHILHEAPPGEIELLVTTPHDFPAGCELVVFPRRPERARSLGDTWSAFGFPSLALQAGMTERFRPRPCPPGVYDVILRADSGLGGAEFRHMGSVAVVADQRSLMPVSFTDAAELCAEVTLAAPGSQAADVVITGADGRVLFIDQVQGARILRLPLGNYFVRADLRRDPRAPQSDGGLTALRLAFEVSMLGATLKLSLTSETW